MDFSLTDEQQQYLEGFRKYCDERIVPDAERLDREASFSREKLGGLAEAGYTGMAVPEGYGGTGAGLVARAAAGTILARACPATFRTAEASSGICATLILAFGTEEQKRSFLPRLAGGETVGAYAFTEPDGGSDPGAIRARAERKGNGFELAGLKSPVTNGPMADLFVVVARTDPGEGGEGLSAFLVDKGREGLRPGQALDTLGVRGSPTSEVAFDGCALTEKDLLGPEGEGMAVAGEALEIGRIGMSVYCIGIMDACLEESIRFAMDRKAFGRPIARYQDVHFRIADMKVLADSARQLLYKVAWLKDTGQPCAELSAALKLYASESAGQCAGWAVQVHGGRGYLRGTVAERLYRDARLGEIAEGTSEMQRAAIVEALAEQY